MLLNLVSPPFSPEFQCLALSLLFSDTISMFYLFSGYLRDALSRLHFPWCVISSQFHIPSVLYLVSIFQIPSRCFISKESAVRYLASISRYPHDALSRLYFLGSFVVRYLVAIFQIPSRRLSSLFSGYLRGALSRLYFQIPSRHFISCLFSGYPCDALSCCGALSRLYFQTPSRCFISSLFPDTFTALYLVSIFWIPSRCLISSLFSTVKWILAYMIPCAYIPTLTFACTLTICITYTPCYHAFTHTRNRSPFLP
jgi:hypothetical protein